MPKNKKNKNAEKMIFKKYHAKILDTIAYHPNHYTDTELFWEKLDTIQYPHTNRGTTLTFFGVFVYFVLVFLTPGRQQSPEVKLQNAGRIIADAQRAQR
jgi:hypothetical protein